jgi:hypothetical protein
MPSRREFIRAGLALSVAPVALPIQESADPTAGIESVTSTHHSLYCVVCDMRSQWSHDFAREAERLGVRVARTSGDITDFWYTDLSLRWREAPVAIGGLTAHGPLFCLERLGWDHGLRVVFRGTHRLPDRGYVEHAISGPTRTVAAAQQVGLNGDWASKVARLLNSCSATRDTTSMSARGALPSGRQGDVHETLLSWVIAPKRA